MKRPLAAAAAILTAVTMTACSGNAPAATVRKNGAESDTATCGMKITFPEGWTVLTGNDIYEKILADNDTGYSDAESLKSAYEKNGSSYIFYAENADKSAQMNITALEITTDENGAGHLSLEEYAQTNHNDTLLGFQIDGYTLDNTGFTPMNIGGNDGFLSQCDVYTDDTLLMGQQEFTFEYGGCFCSLQAYYHTADTGVQVSAIIDGITAG